MAEFRDTAPLRNGDGNENGKLKEKVYRVSYGSWKTWKVMELKHFVSKAWNGMGFNCRSLRVVEIKILFDRLVTADGKERTI